MRAAATTEVLDWLKSKGYETTSKTRVEFVPPPAPPKVMMKAPPRRGPAQTASRRRLEFSSDKT